MHLKRTPKALLRTNAIRASGKFHRQQRRNFHLSSKMIWEFLQGVSVKRLRLAFAAANALQTCVESIRKACQSEPGATLCGHA